MQTWGYSSTTLNLGTRQMWVLSFTPAKCPLVPAEWHHSPPGRRCKENNISLLSGIEPGFLGRPVRSIVAISVPKKHLPSLDSFCFSGLARPRHSQLNVNMILKLLRQDCTIQGHCPWLGRNDLESPSQTALWPGCYPVATGGHGSNCFVLPTLQSECDHLTAYETTTMENESIHSDYHLSSKYTAQSAIRDCTHNRSFT